MTLEELRKLPLFQTRGTAAANDPETLQYIADCFARFYSGDYGEVPRRDTESNNAELAAGNGRIVARYKRRFALQDDIYIIAVFTQETDIEEANNITLMYCNEY